MPQKASRLPVRSLREKSSAPVMRRMFTHMWESEETVLYWNSNCDLQRWGILAKLVGTGPMRWFIAKLKTSSLLKSPSSVGIVPVRWLSVRRSLPVMRRTCIHTWEPIVKKLYRVLEQTVTVTYWEVRDFPNWSAQFHWVDLTPETTLPGCSTVPAQSEWCHSDHCYWDSAAL